MTEDWVTRKKRIPRKIDNFDITAACAERELNKFKRTPHPVFTFREIIYVFDFLFDSYEPQMYTEQSWMENM